MQDEHNEPKTKTVRRIREIWFTVDDDYDLRHLLRDHPPETPDDKERLAAFSGFQKDLKVTLAKPVFSDDLLHPLERVALNLAQRSTESDNQLGRALGLAPDHPRVQRFAVRLAESSRSEGLRMIGRLRRRLPRLHSFYRLRFVEERTVGGGKAAQKAHTNIASPLTLLRNLPGIQAAHDVPGALWDGAPLTPADPWFDPPGGMKLVLKDRTAPQLRDQWNARLINTPIAWQFTTGEKVTVGVIDSGVEATHPDLEGAVHARSDALILDKPGKPGEKDPHGTLVAGIIAARSNQEGICGIAPDATILSYVYGEANPPERKGQKSPAPEPADWVAAIIRAVRNGAKVINCSWHLEVPCCREREVDALMESLRNAIWTAMDQGVTVVCSMGNRSQYNNPYPYESWPAALDGTTYAGTRLVVVGVGGVGFPLAGQELSRFRDSNYGPAMTVMAPGHEAPSTDLSGTEGTNDIDGTTRGQAPWFFNYAPFGGTSAAAAHVSGVVALMLAVNKNLTPAQVQEHLAKTAIPIGTLLSSGADRDDEYGHGLVNAGAAARVAGVLALNKIIATLPGFTRQDQRMAQLLLDNVMSHTALGQAFAGHLWRHADELVTIFTNDPDTAEDVLEQLRKLYPLLRQLSGAPVAANPLGRTVYLRPVRLIIRELLLEHPSAKLRQALTAFRRAARSVLASDDKLVDAVGADEKIRRLRWRPAVR